MIMLISNQFLKIYLQGLGKFIRIGLINYFMRENKRIKIDKIYESKKIGEQPPNGI